MTPINFKPLDIKGKCKAKDFSKQETASSISKILLKPKITEMGYIIWKVLKTCDCLHCDFCKGSLSEIEYLEGVNCYRTTYACLQCQNSGDKFVEAIAKGEY